VHRHGTDGVVDPQALEQVDAIIGEMSQMAAAVATTVEQQTAAVSAIAEGITCASAESQAGADAIRRVGGTSTEARSTAVDVKQLADTLTVAAESLDNEVRQFLAKVEAA
jgi:methyl-accepting chemotaxis protein